MKTALAIAWIVTLLPTLNAGPPHPRPLYTLKDLGTLERRPFCEGIAINESAQVVGGAFDSDDNPIAFLYSGRRMMEIRFGPGPFNYAFAINNRDQILGEFSTGEDEPWIPCLFSNGASRTLAEVTGDPTFFAVGMNDSGTMVGRVGNGFLSAFRPAVYRDGQLTTLGLPSDVGFAVAVNEHGVVAGYSEGPHSFISSNGVLQRLEPFEGSFGTVAEAINDLNDVVGYAILTNAVLRAFVYRGGVMTDLGTLPGWLDTEALDINNQGIIVGRALIDFPGYGADHRAFVYREGRMQDLTSLTRAAAGWEIQRANAINESGQIVGVARHQGVSHAVLLSPVK